VRAYDWCYYYYFSSTAVLFRFLKPSFILSRHHYYVPLLLHCKETAMYCVSDFKVFISSGITFGASNITQPTLVWSGFKDQGRQFLEKGINKNPLNVLLLNNLFSNCLSFPKGLQGLKPTLHWRKIIISKQTDFTWKEN
jgi:hypothetical protein